MTAAKVTAIRATTKAGPRTAAGARAGRDRVAPEVTARGSRSPDLNNATPIQR